MCGCCAQVSFKMYRWCIQVDFRSLRILFKCMESWLHKMRLLPIHPKVSSVKRGGGGNWIKGKRWKGFNNVNPKAQYGWFERSRFWHWSDPPQRANRSEHTINISSAARHTLATQLHEGIPWSGGALGTVLQRSQEGANLRHDLSAPIPEMIFVARVG